MNRVRLAGVGVAAVGVVGYVVGISVAYAGRAFSLTAIMVGFTLVAIARSSATGGET
ncbi:hypothetical protein NP511_13915 [Natrinema thermotolerans]|uniref:Uncharacterized protein n=1 Tax=Natrinema thermotolerans TaxID=121872 RepID=A0AAF0P9M0_9EURY|nr:hypothetical protein [Natrinema thermotolerans]WMT06479.1 hypothetical protein NP511_13915 [Natrinema thermotolerans]